MIEEHKKQCQEIEESVFKELKHIKLLCDQQDSLRPLEFWLMTNRAMITPIIYPPEERNDLEKIKENFKNGLIFGKPEKRSRIVYDPNKEFEPLRIEAYGYRKIIYDNGNGYFGLHVAIFGLEENVSSSQI